MLLWTLFALQHHRYIELDQAGERKRHSNVSTTERHYIKDVPESTLQAMKQLETLCNDCATPKGTKPS